MSWEYQTSRCLPQSFEQDCCQQHNYNRSRLWSRVGNHHFFVHLTLPLRTNTNTISAHCISRNPDVSGLPPNILLKQNQKIMSTSNMCIGKISRYFNRFIRLTFHREEFYSRTRKVHCFWGDTSETLLQLQNCPLLDLFLKIWNWNN